MCRVHDDDVDAFEQLYDRHSVRAYRIATATCHRAGLAEEAVQEGFIAIWKSRKSYQPRSGYATTWIMTTIRNRAIDVTRRDTGYDQRRSDVEGLQRHPAPVDVGADAIAGDNAQRLRTSLAELPATLREVVTLAFYGELSQTEIAAHLRLPVSTIRARMRLALKALRDFR